MVVGKVLLITAAAIWVGIAYGRMNVGPRIAGLVGMFLALVILIISRADVVKYSLYMLGKPLPEAETLSDFFEAYGPTFIHFCLLLTCCIILSVAMKNSEPPYADERQTLRSKPD